MKKNSVMKWLALVFFAIVILNVASKYLNESNAESKAGFAEMQKRFDAMDSIRQNISDLQRDLPQKFTNGNSLDEIKFDEKNKQVLYFFTYENLEARSKEEIKEFEINLNQQTTNFWKNNQSRYAFIDAGVSNKYLIFDKNKREVFNFIIKPEDMK